MRLLVGAPPRKRSRRSRGSGFVRLVVAIGLVAGMVTVAAGPSGAASGWSITPSPSPPGPPSGSLSAVSCPIATRCFAVGSSEAGALVESWDGARWSIVAAPNPSGESLAVLDGVSCASASSCFAVGSSNESTLVEHWNGTMWSVVAAPNPPRPFAGGLSAVSCANATSCIAVGNAATFAANPIVKTLVERWDGTRWSIVADANPATSTFSTLSGVSCASATSCFAVGGTDSGTLVERWNGTRWSLVATPTLPGPLHRSNAVSVSFFPGLNDVSCPTTTNCYAVGESNTGVLVEHWNGTMWSIVSVPSPTGASSPTLNAVSCSSPTQCAAVGSYATTSAATPNKELVEQLNGSRWSIVASPVLPASFAGVGGFAGLTGVSCPTPESCAAVGNSASVDHWNGSSWSIAPLKTMTSQSQLSDVACATPTDCNAVGSSNGNPLVEHWDGTGWSIVASPKPSGAADAALTSVSCPSETDCTAVGSIESALFTSQTLVEHWDGTNWAIVAGPNPSTAQSSLSGVSCPAVGECTAVGSYSTSTTSRTLVEHGNGTTWSIVASPNPSKTDDSLTSVSCSTDTDCSAVGNYLNVTATASAAKTLVEHWNGTTWSVVPSPNPPGAVLPFLNGVACPSPTDCSAVGYSFAFPNLALTNLTVQPLIEHWNGTAWSIIAAPEPGGATQTQLTHVACSTAADCTAVGAYATATSHRTLAQHWNGTRWSLVTTANPTGAALAVLSGIACPAVTSCYAVGTSIANASINTLAERNG